MNVLITQDKLYNYSTQLWLEELFLFLRCCLGRFGFIVTQFE